MIPTLIRIWCCFWGFAAAAATSVAVARVIYDRAAIWRCRARYRSGAARRREWDEAQRILGNAMRGIDDRAFSRGIWKENHYMPREDEQARWIILGAWQQVIKEMYDDDEKFQGRI